MRPFWSTRCSHLHARTHAHARTRTHTRQKYSSTTNQWMDQMHRRVFGVFVGWCLHTQPSVHRSLGIMFKNKHLLNHPPHQPRAPLYPGARGPLFTAPILGTTGPAPAAGGAGGGGGWAPLDDVNKVSPPPPPPPAAAAAPSLGPSWG